MIAAVFDRTPTERIRALSTKLLADPVVPLLGWTKAIELGIVGDRNAAVYLGFGVVATAVWVFADHIERQVEEVADEVEESVEGVADAES